jgi:hypothetical protein
VTKLHCDMSDAVILSFHIWLMIVSFWLIINKVSTHTSTLFYSFLQANIFFLIIAILKSGANNLLSWLFCLSVDLVSFVWSWQS